MPSLTLPSFTQAEVEAHNTNRSCYVTVGQNVYDVTDFLDAHPGGADLVLDYAGKDIGAILKDEDSHTHTEAAYEILEESLVGFLKPDKSFSNGKANGNGAAKGSSSGVDTPELVDAQGRPVHPRTGMSCEEDLNKETDYTGDYKKHKFLDLNKPLLMQVFLGGFSKEFYLEQVHRPRHYKGGESAPLFGNFLEPLSKTAWWVIPIVWLPPVAYGTYLASQGIESKLNLAALWCSGIALWTIIEYILHRFLFHLDKYVFPGPGARLIVQKTVTNRCLLCLQVPSRQSLCNYPPLPSSWRSPLPPYGQASSCDASNPVLRPGVPILEACTLPLLVQLARRHGHFLRWYLWLYLLRPHPLLLAPQESASVVQGLEEIPP